MLAYRDGDGWAQWTGRQRPLDGGGLYTLPANAEALLSDDDLAAYALYRVAEPAVPEGMVVTGYSIDDVNGVPTVVYQIVTPEPDPPAVSAPSAGQIRAALKATGKTDAQIDALFALAAATL